MPPRCQSLLETFCISMNPYKSLCSSCFCLTLCCAAFVQECLECLPSSAKVGSIWILFLIFSRHEMNSFLSPINFTLVELLRVVSLVHDSASRLFSVSAASLLPGLLTLLPPPPGAVDYGVSGQGHRRCSPITCIQILPLAFPDSLILGGRFNVSVSWIPHM